MEVIRYHKHVDNGGISINFGINDGVPSIEFITQYFGYTSISSTLAGYDLDPETLREIGEHFKLFADAYKEHIQKFNDD